MTYSLVIEEFPHAHDVNAVRSGLNSFNAAAGAGLMDEIAAFVRDGDGRVQGGAYGELGWGWLYVDLVWVHESLRGQGWGRRLMRAVEQAARARGMEHIYLATTTFQARPFYERIGYRLFGELEDRPPGHRYFYLQKTATAEPADPSVTVETPLPDDFNALRQGLRDHATSRGVALDARRLAVFLREPDGAISGGLVGTTYWGWFDLQLFWIARHLRGQGYGSLMLELAEREAAARGCPHVVADVTDFQTPGFFYHHGFTRFAELQGRPPGCVTHFLRKDLV